MISIDCQHPDVEKFIDVKRDLTKVTKANISVRMRDDFMEAALNDTLYNLVFEGKVYKTVRARDVLHKLAINNHAMGEPGILYWNRVELWSLLSNNYNFEFEGVNPCLTGDTLIQTTEGTIPIKDLVGSQPLVYCVDNNCGLTVRQASNVWLTRKQTDVVEVTTYRGKIRCTPDHRILTKTGWVEARNLTPGMKLVGLNRTLCTMEEIRKKRTINLGNDTSKSWIVQAVVELTDPEDVYDMTVPGVHNFIANNIVVHNCGEQPLPAGGSCMLYSENLAEMVIKSFTKNAYFDLGKLDKVTRSAVVFMNMILDEGLSLLPLAEQRESVTNWRQIGIGIMGLADAFIKCGIKYGSPDSIKLVHKMGRTMINAALQQSALLAKESGPYPMYDKKATLDSPFFQFNADPDTKKLVTKYGLRNSQLLTIAPTGTISNMLGVSGGMEPIFATYYTRKTETLNSEDTYYKVYTPVVKEYMELNNILDEKDLPDFIVSAHDIDYRDRLALQAAWQDHIDAAISSTVNVPESFTVEDVENLYIEAWQLGLKGVTIFRDNCERAGILTVGKSDKPEAGKDICPECGEKLENSGGCVQCKCGWSKCG